MTFIFDQSVFLSFVVKVESFFISTILTNLVEASY